MLRANLTAILLTAVLAGCSGNTSKPAQEAKGATPPPAPPVAATSAPATDKGSAGPAQEAAKKPPKKTEPNANAQTGSPMDRFAKCLAQKDATMYGVFWCDHCREQKEKFGDSFKYVKYVECVTPDAPRTLIPECKAQGIKHTPTWIFSDGEHIEGVMGIDQLAMKTQCKMP